MNCFLYEKTKADDLCSLNNRSDGADTNTSHESVTLAWAHPTVGINNLSESDLREANQCESGR